MISAYFIRDKCEERLEMHNLLAATLRQLEEELGNHIDSMDLYVLANQQLKTIVSSRVCSALRPALEEQHYKVEYFDSGLYHSVDDTQEICISWGHLGPTPDDE